MSDPLSDWLARHGLERLLPLLRENEVDLATLLRLTEDDLKELGLAFGPRKRLLQLTADERPKQQPAAAAANSAAERRHLTVLFCDMVDFTRLAHRLDPERLQKVVRAYEAACAACVSRYDGIVFTTLGDGVVAFFGYPIAHESEAERAVRAALDILAAVAKLSAPGVARLQVRLGIAAGLVVVAPGERNAVGETMSLASRLQAAAEPGEIVVSDTVRKLAGGAFRYEDLGKRNLKGVRAPVRIHRILGLSGVESRFAAATFGSHAPLVGRKTELETALAAWNETRETGTGRALLLTGDGGLGKSRIVAALRDRLGADVQNTVFLQASPFFAHTAFHPVVHWLERELDLRPDDPEPSRLDKLEAFLGNRFGFGPDLLRLIAALLSTPFRKRYGDIVFPPKAARAATIRALVEIMRAHANEAPTLIVFEDLHWADPTTREWLETLVGGLSEIPALLIATTRPDFEPRWAAGERAAALRLERFDASESRELLKSIADAALLPADLANQIVARAEGVPLFITELTKSVLESLSDAAAGVSLPMTLRDSLMARLDRAPAAKELAQIGSVFGREFAPDLIASLGLVPAEALHAGLGALTASGLVSVSGEWPNSTYAFSHALVQDAAYESLLKSRRRRLHAKVAQALLTQRPEIVRSTPELLAFHYTAAEQHRLAAPLWLKAGEAALSRFALAESVSHLRAGLSSSARMRPSRSRDVAELKLRSLLGPALVASRGWANPEVAIALQPAWRLAQSLGYGQSYLPILSALAVNAMSAGTLGASLAWCERMIALGRERDDDALLLVGHRSAAATRYWTGDLKGALEEGDVVHRLYNLDRHGKIVALTNSDPLTGEGVYRSQFLWILGYPEQALRANALAEAHARALGHPFDLAFLLTLGAQLFAYLGDWRALLARAEEAISIGRERGISLLGEMLAEIGRGVAWLQAGRFEDAARQLEVSVARLEATGHGVWICYLRALQAQALAEMGRQAEAVALMDASVTKMAAGEEQVHFAETLRLRGWLAARQGEPTTAEHFLRRAVDCARGQGARSWELRACVDLARLLAQSGRLDEARLLLPPVYRQFTEGFETLDLVKARQAMAGIGVPT